MTRHPATASVRLAATAAATLLAAGCGSAQAPGYGTSAAGASSPASSKRAIAVGATKLGRVLVDEHGRTLYLLTADSPDHSSCSDQCLGYWPPVAAPATGSIPSVAGISAGLARTKATSGQAMLTAGGWPLYTFVKDRKIGDVTGQGVHTFGGTWYVVSPAGHPIKAAPAGTPAAPGNGYRGGGY